MKFILIADEEGVPISFFPFWEVIIFVTVVTCLLIALYPRYLLQTVLEDKQPTAVSIGYLKAFQHMFPQDESILLTLIQQEITIGEPKAARNYFATLKEMELNPSPEALNQFRWIDYLMLRFETYHSKKNTPRHAELMQKLRLMAKSLADVPLSAPELKTLAMDNLALNQAAVSLEIYQHLLDRNELFTPDEFAVGGSIAMQNNAHLSSAKFYMAAYNKAITTEEKRHYAVTVIKVLWEGNYVQQALSFATSLPEAVIDDRETLLYLTQLSMAADRPDLAQKYALKALLFEQSIKHE